MKSVTKYLLFSLAMASSIAVDAQELVSGDVIGRHIYGLAIDYQGDPVLVEDKPLIHKKSSFEQLINLENSNFLVSSFSDIIGSIYITEFNKKDNKYIDTVALNLSGIDGLSQPVAGIKTNWNSVLFAENRPVDAAKPEEFIESFKPYYKGKSNLVNPYKYGWLSEVIILDAKGEAKAIKSYALGRINANQIALMPDGKTIYMLDSIGNLYLFVAEQANSMAKGKLYAVSREKEKINYTLLGNSSALKVKFKLKKIAFNSIFKSSKPKSQRCKNKYQYINTIYGEECLMLKSKNKKYAAFFEPVRMRALKGIPGFTTGNSQMTFNAKENQLLFKQTDQTELKLVVGPNFKLNPQFIIKEQL